MNTQSQLPAAVQGHTDPICISFLRRSALRAAIALGVVFGPAGCIEDGEFDEAAIDDDDDASDPSEVSPRSYWTSEEYTPATCSSASAPLVAHINCDGSFCDNISLDCDTQRNDPTALHPLPIPPLAPPPPPTVGASTWSSWFSEEGAASNLNSRKCSGATWLTGIKCRGSYCDEISIRCSEMFDADSGTPKSPSNCTWSDWYSEEDDFVSFAFSSFIRGVKCQGSYCDEMAYLVCDM